MKLVKPRRGIILAGIPAKGAEVTDALAKEWLDNGLVTLVNPEPPKRKPGRPPKVVAPVTREAE